MLVSRSQVQSVERSKRAKVWAIEDDGHPPNASIPPPAITLPKPMSSTSTASSTATSSPSPPLTAALVGVTLMGDLDTIYHASSYPDIELQSLISHTRKTQGKILIFAYTFRGHLCLSLGWDGLGFRQGVVEEFWERVNNGVDEFLVPRGQTTSHRL